MRDRRGWGILVVLIAMLIAGYLFVKQAQVMLPAKGGRTTGTALPDQARIETFKLTAMMVRNAIAMHQASTGKTPSKWDELASLGIDTRQKDPWGGAYYLQSGRLRCTGNPKVSESL